jgi:phage terminase large subunit GpA-like protein
VDLDALVASQFSLWRPPPRLHLDEWADQFFYLSPESAAEPGRWRTLPYQRGILRAISDPTVERVSFMKSARVGATKMMCAMIAYSIAADPCSMMVVQPAQEDAEGFSKDEIAPMLRDVPVLAGIVGEPRAKDTSNTILAKQFPGGKLLIVGAHSGRGFRRVSIKRLFADEVDAYPPSAGAEGDQIRLAIRRTEYFADRKIVCASTPTIAGASRIEEMFEAGDRRRYHVPCPYCGVFDVLVFRQDDGGRGHFMTWPEGRPESAHFVCSACSRAIEHKQKREMVEAGEWQAEGEFSGHASFHIWSAYSYSPNASWGQIAAEYVEAETSGPEALRTVVNTLLGQTWTTQGEAPEWERLHRRRESYLAEVPAGVRLLTAGVDVQRDRLVYEVVGWGAGKESWGIERGEFVGDTGHEGGEVWRELDKLLAEEWRGVDGSVFGILRLAIDSGDQTQTVYAWARRHPHTVMAVKGSASAPALLSSPRRVAVTVAGRPIPDGCKLWIVGVNQAKEQLYGWLRMDAGETGPPPGFCHFPDSADYSEEYFRQLTAEQLVSTKNRHGFTERRWMLIPGRQNHALDARIYARAAAAPSQIDRMLRGERVPAATRPAASPPPQPADPPDPTPTTTTQPQARPRGSWLDKSVGMRSRRRGGWLR